MRLLGAELTDIAPGRVRISPADGERLEAIGTVLKSGRTLSVCQLQVFAAQGETRKLIAAGQQTLIRVPGQTDS
jgi:acyl-coenzyme A thioesterase PaaI-like protein